MKIALLIGVTEYGEDIPNLTAPANDVQKLARVLEHSDMGGFDSVKPLINANQAQIQRAILKLFRDAGRDDLLLLFFSGHGITSDSHQLYLSTCQTSKQDFEATAVPAWFVQQQSASSYAQRQVLILDCCYSGAFREGWHAKSVGLNLKQQLKVDEMGSQGRVVLTSSAATQTSFQQDTPDLSLYTQYLLEGMETGAADKDRNGLIYVHELHDYARKKVQEVKPKQKPQIISDKEGFNIVLSRAPINDSLLLFRQMVEQYAKDGEITSVGKEILGVQQAKLEIGQEKAHEIINSVLEPYRRQLRNRDHYRETFKQVIQEHDPLTERLRNELNDFQQMLGLDEENVKQIEHEVLKQIEHESKTVETTSIMPSDHQDSSTIILQPKSNCSKEQTNWSEAGNVEPIKTEEALVEIIENEPLVEIIESTNLSKLEEEPLVEITESVNPSKLMDTGTNLQIVCYPLCQQVPEMKTNKKSFHQAISALVREKKPLKLLLISSGTGRTGTDQEIDTLAERIQQKAAVIKIKVEIKKVPTSSASISQVKKLLEKCSYHIVHYAGHSKFDAATGENSGLIFYQHPKNRSGEEMLTARTLFTLLRDSQTVLFYLSSCVGATVAGKEVLQGKDCLGIMEAIIQAGIPTVFGYRWYVTDSGAQRFANQFYESLLATRSPKRAALKARQSTYNQEGDDETWLSPILVVQNL